MSFENVKSYMTKFGYENKMMQFEVSSATVELAAEAVGCKPAHIAKSLTFMVGEKVVMIVCAGDTKIDNSKYKMTFSCKAKMLSFDEVYELVGHKVGGVCPFSIKEGVEVYFDEMLKRFEVVYPACGSSNSAIGLSIDEFEKLAQNFKGYVDVCKLIEG